MLSLIEVLFYVYGGYLLMVFCSIILIMRHWIIQS